MLERPSFASARKSPAVDREKTLVEKNKRMRDTDEAEMMLHDIKIIEEEIT